MGRGGVREGRQLVDKSLAEDARGRSEGGEYLGDDPLARLVEPPRVVPAEKFGGPHWRGGSDRSGMLMFNVCECYGTNRTYQEADDVAFPYSCAESWHSLRSQTLMTRRLRASD